MTNSSFTSSKKVINEVKRRYMIQLSLQLDCVSEVTVRPEGATST